MKQKLLLTLVALFSVIGGVKADFTQPEAGKLFTMHCAATDGHETTPYLNIKSEQINAAAAKGSYFAFESASDGAWYIKDAISNKYLYAESETSGTSITLSEEATTSWTVTTQANGIRFVASGHFLNNLGGSLALRDGQGGCSSWVLTEITDVVSGESFDTNFKEGYYNIEVSEGNAQNHATYYGYYLRGVKNGNWGITLTQTPENDPTSYIYITKVSDGNYKFTFNKGTSQEYTVSQTTQENASAGNFQFNPKNNSVSNYLFTIWGGSNRIIGWTINNIASLGNTSTSNDANNSCYYVFHKVDAPAIVTYVYKCEGREDISIVKSHSASDIYAAPVLPAFGTIKSMSKSGIVENEATCDVNYTMNLPFTSGYVYRLKVRNSGDGKYVSFSNSKPVTNSTNGSDFALDNLWTIERVNGTINDYKIYNLAASQYINGNGFSSAGKAYTIGEFTDKDGGFNFVVSGTTNNSLGDHTSVNGQGNVQLGEWSGGSNKDDAGSCFWVEDITTEINNLTTMGDAQSKFLGLASRNVNASAKTAAATTPSVENVKALFTVNFADAVNTGKYYRISNYDTGRSEGNWLSSDAFANASGAVQVEGRKLGSMDAVGGVAALFQFEENDGAYYLTHTNSGLSICNLTSNNSAMDFPINKVSAGTFTVDQVSGKWWSIKTKTANEYLHQSNWGGSTKQVLIWSTTPSIASCSASIWSIEEVTEIPVAVGSVGYTTYCFPVNVIIPNTGVEAYIVKAKDASHVQLVQYSGSIIPANTGVVLKNEGTYNFAITSTNADGEVTGNLLTGATIRRQGFGADVNYVLVNKENGVGFYKNGSVATIPANKAYLPVTNISSGAAMLTFDFDDAIETAINELETEKLANSTIYDVQGRRVMNPTKGLYIVNGKKVMFK